MEPNPETLLGVLNQFFAKLVALLDHKLLVRDVKWHFKLVECSDHVFCLQLPRFQVLYFSTHPCLHYANLML